MKCLRCGKYIGSTTYKYCPYCGILLNIPSDADGWQDGYTYGT